MDGGDFDLNEEFREKVGDQSFDLKDIIDLAEEYEQQLADILDVAPTGTLGEYIETGAINNDEYEGYDAEEQNPKFIIRRLVDMFSYVDGMKRRIESFSEEMDVFVDSIFTALRLPPNQADENSVVYLANMLPVDTTYRAIEIFFEKCLKDEFDDAVANNFLALGLRGSIFNKCITPSSVPLKEFFKTMLAMSEKDSAWERRIATTLITGRPEIAHFDGYGAVFRWVRTQPLLSIIVGPARGGLARNYTADGPTRHFSDIAFIERSDKRRRNMDGDDDDYSRKSKKFK